VFRPSVVILAVILLLGPLLVVELGTRLLIARDRLPEAPASSEIAEISLANLWRQGQPDVLVLGSSTVRNAIKPDVLEALISDETGQQVHVQSIAQGGISLRGQRLIVQHLADEGMLPRVVITGVSAATLSGAHDLGTDWFTESELGQLWSGCAESGSDLETFECRLGQSSALWRWRGRPDRILRAMETDMPRTITDNGRTLKASGWLSTDPSTPARLEQNIDRALGSIGDEIDLPDVVVDGFAALIDQLRAHDVEVIAIEMPYSPQFESALLERNPDWQRERAAGWARLEEVADFELIDVGAFGDWAQASSFRDPRHLSRKGAEPFMRQLWAMSEFRDPLLAGLASAD
jgi:hypothetical protein